MQSYSSWANNRRLLYFSRATLLMFSFSLADSPLSHTLFLSLSLCLSKQCSMHIIFQSSVVPQGHGCQGFYITGLKAPSRGLNWLTLGFRKNTWAPLAHLSCFFTLSVFGLSWHILWNTVLYLFRECDLYRVCLFSWGCCTIFDISKLLNSICHAV